MFLWPSVLRTCVVFIAVVWAVTSVILWVALSGILRWEGGVCYSLCMTKGQEEKGLVCPEEVNAEEQRTGFLPQTLRNLASATSLPTACESSWYLWNASWDMLLCVHPCMLSHVRLFATLWAVACQDPLSMGFSRREYWSRLLFPNPGVLPDPGIEPTSPALQVNSLLPSHQGSPWDVISF